ncbi:hypothetical protein [Vreelandella salicampi]|uniref:hypothetical protein n=1 Tax=Vreelandella salicampi TaxID=1449798 RepID=UPI001F506681|nr:hypothetical protein [Halomonas salicampi]
MPTSLDSHDRLTDLKRFATDPGSLQSDTYIPKNFPNNGPLVVVLHGSTQSAEGYDCGEEGKYMLEVGISSTRHIANFWGLT